MTFQTSLRKQLADACMPAHPVLQRCSLPDLQVHAASRPHDGPFCSSHVASGFPAHAHLQQSKLCSYGRRHVDDVCPKTPPPPFDCQETPLERPVFFVNTFLQLNKGTKTERKLSKMFTAGQLPRNTERPSASSYTLFTIIVSGFVAGKTSPRSDPCMSDEVPPMSRASS